MTAHILLVEDNLGDVRLMREAFNNCDRKVDLHVAGDGAEAMAFLNKQGHYGDAPRPDFIVLDLNLPKLSGQGVLACIRKNQELCTIPIFILTSSAAGEDVTQCYQLTANCYITKPVGYDQFESLVALLALFWLTIVTLPPYPAVV